MLQVSYAAENHYSTIIIQEEWLSSVSPTMSLCVLLNGGISFFKIKWPSHSHFLNHYIHISHTPFINPWHSCAHSRKYCSRHNIFLSQFKNSKSQYFLIHRVLSERKTKHSQQFWVWKYGKETMGCIFTLNQCVNEQDNFKTSSLTPRAQLEACF